MAGEKLTRRQLLAAAALAAAALACGEDAPNLPAYQTEAPKPHNGYFNAASVLLNYKNPDGSENGFGHAGLFIQENKLFLVTAQHVQDIGTANVLFPGSTDHSYRILPIIWNKLPKSDSTDNVINMQDNLQVGSLPDFNFLDALSIAIQAGAIKPLQMLQYGVLSQGQTVGLAMGDNGQILQFQYNGYDSDNNVLDISTLNGEDCAGYSGSPILLLDSNGNPNGASIGILVAGNGIITGCGSLAYAIPFFTDYVDL